METHTIRTKINKKQRTLDGEKKEETEIVEEETEIEEEPDKEEVIEVEEEREETF